MKLKLVGIMHVAFLIVHSDYDEHMDWIPVRSSGHLARCHFKPKPKPAAPKVPAAAKPVKDEAAPR